MVLKEIISNIIYMSVVKTNLLLNLPNEIINHIYSFVGTHKMLTNGLEPDEYSITLKERFELFNEWNYNDGIYSNFYVGFSTYHLNSFNYRGISKSDYYKSKNHNESDTIDFLEYILFQNNKLKGTFIKNL